MKYPDNEYRQRDYEALKAFCTELNSLGSTYKFNFIEDNTNDSREQVVLSGLIPIHAKPKDYQGKYSFGLWYKLPYIDYNDYKEVAEKYVKPQNIGVLNAKKVNNWIDYLIKIYEDLIKVSQEKESKVNEFLAEAKEAGIEIVTTSGIRGSIIKNGIEFSFEVDSRNGYISKKLELHYSVSNTLEAFEAISDNKYRA